MNFHDLNFKPSRMPGGIQAIVKFGDYSLSIIQSSMSYGGSEGLYEIGVYNYTEKKMVELPGVTDEGDTVKGYLTESDVTAILLKMHSLTGKEPTF